MYVVCVASIFCRQQVDDDLFMAVLQVLSCVALDVLLFKHDDVTRGPTVNIMPHFDTP